MYHTPRKSRKPRNRSRNRVQRSHPRMDTSQLTREWHKITPEFLPGQVATALAIGGDSLTDRAYRRWIPHAESICRDYRLPPEAVDNLFGPEFHAAAIVTVYYGTDCLYRQTQAARHFLNSAETRARLAGWNMMRSAS